MRNIPLTTVNSLGPIPPIKDITDLLPRGKRWEELRKPYRHKGHWDGVTYHTGFRNPEDIDTIVIHHSGSPEGTIASHADYHRRKWGAGIAYHMVIDHGQIFQTNDLLSFTYHVGNHNTYTVGICVNRDIRNYDLTDLERNLLYAAILSVKAVLPIKDIKGHNELNPTQCPVTSVQRIRQDMAALEEHLSYLGSPNAQIAAIVALTARVEELANRLTSIWAIEAARKLQIVEDIVHDFSFAQDGVNAQERIAGLYKTFLGGGEYKAEAQRKLSLIAQEAKKHGLIA